MKTMYWARRNSDLTEGRGPMMIIAAFLNREDAVKAAKGWGVMGLGDGQVDPFIVFDSFEEFEDINDKTLRRTALEKLSSEERRVLGL